MTSLMNAPGTVLLCVNFCRWMVLSSKGNIERASRKGIKLGNILKTLSFGDWLVLSLLGSNVQSSYYEQVNIGLEKSGSWAN
jgi:hypothetical protein